MSANGRSLEAELVSESKPKVPCRLIGLDVVVSGFVRSKFRYIGLVRMIQDQRFQVDKLYSKSDQRFGVRRAKQQVDVDS